MNDLELIFTMLGEAAATRIAKSKDVHGLDENKIAAKQGGEAAGNARLDIEEKTGESAVTEENFIDTEKIGFAQTRYFSGEIRKSNFRGAQELHARSGIYSGVLDIPEKLKKKRKKIVENTADFVG